MEDYNKKRKELKEKYNSPVHQGIAKNSETRILKKENELEKKVKANAFKLKNGNLVSIKISRFDFYFGEGFKFRFKPAIRINLLKNCYEF